MSTKVGQNIYDHKIWNELIMGIIGPEQLELFALELKEKKKKRKKKKKKKKNCYIWLCLLSSIYNIYPISTKLGQNIYNHNKLDEFDYGSNRIRKTGVIYPWIRKKCYIWLCLHSSIYNY